MLRFKRSIYFGSDEARDMTENERKMEDCTYEMASLW
jgi:hypothetical protein